MKFLICTSQDFSSSPAFPADSSANLAKGQILEQAEQHHPEITLIDIRMADMDGVAVIHEIKKTCPAMVLLLMTDGADFVAKARAEGPAAVLTKPIDVPQLFAALGPSYQSSTPHPARSKG